MANNLIRMASLGVGMVPMDRDRVMGLVSYSKS